jgi:hypothetical protein
VVKHQHNAAVQVRLLIEDGVRLREKHAALLGHRELVHPP